MVAKDDKIYQLRLLVQKLEVAPSSVTNEDRGRALGLASELLAELGRRSVTDETLRGIARELGTKREACFEAATSRFACEAGPKGKAYILGRASALCDVAQLISNLVDPPF